ncbi:MAG: LysM domain-containing protein [Planctomycetota bacterium]|nr:LysM domain-containing protein [Planctomycetota bacterium]
MQDQTNDSTHGAVAPCLRSPSHDSLTGSILTSLMLLTLGVGCSSAPTDRESSIGTAVGPADVAAMATGTWQMRSEEQQGMAVLGGLLAYDMTTTEQVDGVAVARERISAGPLWIAGTTESRAITSAGEESHGHWFFPFWRYEEVDGERTLYPLMMIPIPLGNSSGSDQAQFEEDLKWQKPVAEAIAPSGLDPSTVIDPISEISQLDPLARTYRLRQGDTLWSVSKRFYGTGQRWRDLVSANHAGLEDLHSIRIGTTIVIPQ